MSRSFLIFVLLLLISLFAFCFDITNTGEETVVFESESKAKLVIDEDSYLDLKNLSLPQAGWIVGISSEVIFGSKKDLHHLHLFNQAKPDLTCPTMEERIFAAGPETTDDDFPALFGYRVEKGQDLRLTAHIKNSQKTDLENVKLRLKIKFQPDSLLAGRIDLQPLFLDTVNCSYDPSFTVYPGKRDYLSQSNFVASQTRRIAFIGGHVHKYAEKLEVKVNGESFWQAIPKKDTTGEITAMPVGVYYGAKKIEKDDRIWLESTYNNSENRLADGMGIAILYLIK